MFGRVKGWFGGWMERAVGHQHSQLRKELEETKKLPPTPERIKLIQQTEALLAEGSDENKTAYSKAKFDKLEVDIKELRAQLAADDAHQERQKIAAKQKRAEKLQKH